MKAHYTIVLGSDIKDLEERVNANLQKGYRPAGGFFTDVVNTTRWFYQAMILEKDE